ncbi:MAG: T9SS type A sorting domain-containing protein [Bacteroidia bacterium]
MYPNPTTGTVYISGGNISDTQLYVEVQDLTGRTISKQTLTVTNGVVTLQNTLENGVYMLNIKGEDGKVVTQKLVVNN